MTAPRLISGLSELAPSYDALICDVWGVIHDGHKAHPEASQALQRFRQHHGPVVLLTNAPRLPSEVAAQCAQYGVPPGCYDAIVSSGGAARDELIRRSQKTELPLYYIGPDKDLAVVEGLSVTRTGIKDAQLAFCTGLEDDLTETVADYADRLAALNEGGLTMICANPDLVVHRGPQLCYCAGALAKEYERLGGAVIYYGKPHRPVYDAALAAAKSPKRALVVGDGLFTDILGANRAGIDALFIADGVHGEETQPYTEGHLGQLFQGAGVHARAACRTLEMGEAMTYYYEDLQVGMSESMSHTVTERDVELFAEATGDRNPRAFRRNLCPQNRVPGAGGAWRAVHRVYLGSDGDEDSGAGKHFHVRHHALQCAGQDRRYRGHHLPRGRDPRTAQCGDVLQM